MNLTKDKVKSFIFACLFTIILINSLIIEACDVHEQASYLFKGSGQHKVVLILVDHIDLQDFSEDPYLRQLGNNGYFALVSGRQTGKATASKARLTVGTGRRLELGSPMIQASNYQDFLSYHGEAQPGNVFLNNISSLRHLNKNNEYNSYLGYLGNQLNDLAKTTGVIGNSDTRVNNRSALLIAMDGKGIVDLGDVENCLTYDNDFPGGKRTDYQKLEELYKQYLPASDFLVVDTGDMARLDYYSSDLTEDSYQYYKKLIRSRVSEFIENAIASKDVNTTFLIYSSYPSKSSIKAGNKLTPLIYYDGADQGLIYSKSTKRTGIITNLDMADFILSKFKSDGKSQLTLQKSESPLENMLLLKSRLLNVSLMRLPVLTWYALFEIICAIFAFVYMLYMKKFKNKKVLTVVEVTLLVNIIAPAALLYLAILNVNQPIIYFVAFIGASYLAAFFISKLFANTINKFGAAAFLVNGSLFIDLIRDSVLIKNSIFGYDPIIGARFYGIGNEFAGVYIGSGILLVGCVLQGLKENAFKKSGMTKAVMLLYFLIQLVVIGSPNYGANFGAAIAAVCGYFFFFTGVNGSRITVKHMLLLIVLLALVVTSIAIFDLTLSDTTSHVGKFIRDIKENGIQVLLSTFSRKIEMNIKLIKYTIWTKVLLCIILIITMMFFKPVRLMHSIFKKYKYLTTAWLGISAASIAGLIVNDSGIVMAATAMIFTGYTILYMCLEEVTPT